MAKKKFYTVWIGHHPGVYDSWEDAQEQINGYPGASFKGFETSKEATEAYREGRAQAERRELSKLISGASGHRPSGAAQSDYFQFPEIDLRGWAVDAACAGNPGVMEYRCVELMSGREIFHVGPFDHATNNIGEFLAIVHALALMYRDNDWHTLYTDSRTAMSWVARKQPKTTLKPDERNRKLFELLGRGMIWLRSHEWPIKILKWDTEKWGEIPADFNRK